MTKLAPVKFYDATKTGLKKCIRLLLPIMAGYPAHAAKESELIKDDFIR